MEKSKLPPAFLNIAKPPGLTAHDVVNRVRRITGMKQVGHAGTLDPAATGVLPIALGKACRLLRFLSTDKVYVAEILLGTVTDTDDLDGQIIATTEQLPDAKLIAPALDEFIGDLQQLPPLYSAVHHQGQRLYALARKGEIPEGIALRCVTVHKLELLEISLPVVRTRISCSTGTYIRSIARDLGKSLNCGGCLQSLVREQSGPFPLQQAIDLDHLQLLAEQGKLSEVLISPTEVLELKCMELDKLQVQALLKGQVISPVGACLGPTLTAAESAAARLIAAPHGAPLTTPKSAGVHDGQESVGGEATQRVAERPAPIESEFILATYNGLLIAVCEKTVQGTLKPEVVIGNSEQIH